MDCVAEQALNIVHGMYVGDSIVYTVREMHTNGTCANAAERLSVMRQKESLSLLSKFHFEMSIKKLTSSIGSVSLYFFNRCFHARTFVT